MTWLRYLAILAFLMVAGNANVALPCAEPYDPCVCPWVEVSTVYEAQLEGDTGALVPRVRTVHVAGEGELEAPTYAVGDTIDYQWLSQYEPGASLLFLESADREIISTFELDENGHAHCWADPSVDFTSADVASLVIGEAHDDCEDRLQEDFEFSPYPAAEEAEDDDEGSCLFFGCSTGMTRSGAGRGYGLFACVVALAGLGILRRR